MGIDAIDAIDAIDTIEEGIEGDFLNRGSVSCQNNRPSEAHRFGCSFLQAALRLRLACMELSTIRHLRWYFRFDFGGFGVIW